MEELRVLVYKEEEEEESNVFSDSQYDLKWPALDFLLSREGKKKSYTETITEVLGKDYSGEPAMLMLLLVESLIAVSI